MDKEVLGCNSAFVGKVFRRIEKKYLISAEQKAELLGMCSDLLCPNRYFRSTVCSIYFDSKNDDLIIKQIDKPLEKVLFKEKVRLRSYDVPKMDDDVFFEVKTKMISGVNKIGDKRRFELLLSDFYDWYEKKIPLKKIAERKIEKTNDQHIACEIEYLVKFLRLEPKIFIACERSSYDASDSSELRVTFDENLRFRCDDLRLEKGSRGIPFFDEEKNIILEIKTSCGMPLWLVSALNKLKIYPQAFSKYGKIYQKMKGEKLNVQYHL